MVEPFFIAAKNRLGPPARRLVQWFGFGPAGFWIAALVLVLVGGRFLWLQAARPAHQEEIAGAFGSVGYLYGTPQSTRSGDRITFLQTTTNGVGVFVCNTITGEKQLVTEEYGRENGWRLDHAVWPWSPDDKLFLYTRSLLDDELFRYTQDILVICQGSTGGTLAKVNLGDQPVKELAWLTPDLLAYVSQTVKLNLVHRRTDGQWERTLVAGVMPGSALAAWSTNTLVWNLNKQIQAINLDTGGITVLYQAQANQSLDSFAFDQASRKFLVQSSHDDRVALWQVSPGNDPVKIATCPSAVSTIGWLTATNGSCVYLCPKSATSVDQVLRFQPGFQAEPSQMFAHETAKAFTVSAGGSRLFMVGTVSNEPAEGIWQYDVVSQRLRCVVACTDQPSPYARHIEPLRCGFKLKSGVTADYYLYLPANFKRWQHKKYPLVIGDTLYRIADAEHQNRIHGPLWADAVAGCGAYVVIVNRPGWFDGLDQWGENVLEVYQQLARNPTIDTDRVFLFGASAETSPLSQLVKARPGLWNGLVLLNPTGLPQMADLPAGRSAPRMLICAGEEEREESRLTQYQAEAGRNGVEVDLLIHPNSTHYVISIAALQERIRAIVDFIFNDRINNQRVQIDNRLAANPKSGPKSLTDLGAASPVPSPGDVAQLSNGNQSNDGLNYYTDEGQKGKANSWPGQTFTTGSDATGYMLNYVDIKTVGKVNAFATVQPYQLRLYSISAGQATLLASYDDRVALTEGDWLQWTNLGVPLLPNTQYAYTFGRAADGNDWIQLANTSGNPYRGGQICGIPAAGGAVDYGVNGNSDAVFVAGVSPLSPSQAPLASLPLISPASDPIYSRTPVTLTENAAGVSLAYQWQTDGGTGGDLTNIPDATGINLPLDTTSMVAGKYRYATVVSNRFGATTSAVASLTIAPASVPIMVSDIFPARLAANAGSPVQFSVVVDGTQPIHYQWRVDQGGGPVNLPGATNSLLVLDNVQMSDSGQYSVMASNAIGGPLWSGSSTLTVISKSLTDIGAASPVPGPDDIAQLAFGNNDNDGLNYYTDEGQKGEWNLWPGQIFTTGNGASGYVLNYVDIKTAWWGTNFTALQPYRLRFYSIAGGQATLLATYEDYLAGIEGDWLQWTNLRLPLLPNTQYAYTFGRTADGTGWEQLANTGGNPYADGQICGIPAAGGPVTLSKKGGSDATFIVGLSLLRAPLTSLPLVSPASDPIYSRTPVTLTENAVGVSLTYQWRTDGGFGGVLTNIPGATGAKLLLDTTSLAAGKYRYAVVVSSRFGTATSAVTSLTIVPASATFMVRNISPIKPSIYAGSSVKFSVVMAGTQPIRYQWRVDQGSGPVNLPDATNSSLMLDNVQMSDAGRYSVVASDAIGSPVWSSSSLLTVSPKLLTDIGAGSPTPGLDEIAQLLDANKDNDGLNYYTDEGQKGEANSWPGQTFTTGSGVTGYVLNQVAIKTAGKGNAFTAVQPYQLRLYSISGGNATLLATFDDRVAGSEHDWLQWTNLMVPLLPNRQYAYTFGRTADGNGKEQLANIGGNPYPGGQICGIAAAGGSVDYAVNGDSDAAFVVGMSPLSAPFTTLPAISPTNSQIYCGMPVTLTERADGLFPVYQWQTDGGTGGVLTNVPGATSASLRLNTATFAPGIYQYAVTVTNQAGASTSPVATLAIATTRAPVLVSDIDPAPEVAAQVSESLTFSATYASKLPLRYQWQVDHGSGPVNLSGATNSTLVLTNIRLSDAGSYSVTAKNSASGPVVSSSSKLTVIKPTGDFTSQ